MCIHTHTTISHTHVKDPAVHFWVWVDYRKYLSLHWKVSAFPMVKLDTIQKKSTVRPRPWWSWTLYRRRVQWDLTHGEVGHYTEEGYNEASPMVKLDTIQKKGTTRPRPWWRWTLYRRRVQWDLTHGEVGHYTEEEEYNEASPMVKLDTIQKKSTMRPHPWWSGTLYGRRSVQWGLAHGEDGHYMEEEEYNETLPMVKMDTIWKKKRTMRPCPWWSGTLYRRSVQWGLAHGEVGHYTEEAYNEALPMVKLDTIRKKSTMRPCPWWSWTLYGRRSVQWGLAHGEVGHSTEEAAYNEALSMVKLDTIRKK